MKPKTRARPTRRAVSKNRKRRINPNALRTWVSKTRLRGKKRMNATPLRFVKREGEHIFMKRLDGTTIKVPLLMRDFGSDYLQGISEIRKPGKKPEMIYYYFSEDDILRVYNEKSNLIGEFYTYEQMSQREIFKLDYRESKLSTLAMDLVEHQEAAEGIQISHRHTNSPEHRAIFEHRGYRIVRNEQSTIPKKFHLRKTLKPVSPKLSLDQTHRIRYMNRNGRIAYLNLPIAK
tara:strand:- start:1150 stop:1848 length:699 start_codon:yes stop_codon:yes gene_type:complete